MTRFGYATLYNMKLEQLSVFFPSFNEEGNIELTVSKAIKILEQSGLQYEIIIVNDGSTDKTAFVAENLSKRNSKVRVINHPQNLGYGEALKSGFYNAKYDTIVYTDGDGQFDFAEVTKFLEKIQNFDLVIGYRIKRQDPFLRRLFGKGWRLSLLIFFGLTLKDVDCGFKMIKRSVLKKIPHLESQRGAMINAEVAIKAKKFGFKVDQVGVNHYPRISGKPTGAGVRVIIKSYLDLLRLWWKLKDQKMLFIALILILGLAAFLRLYQIPGYMTFLGDEGRDALIMKKILSGDLPMIGPPTSVGNIYLGPLYYYMMFLSMAPTNLNPISAAIMNALIGILIVALVYYLGKIWFGRIGGMVASFLYAISPVNIIYSRSSWNPNPAPFFALLGMFSLYRVHKTGNFLWLVLTGFAFAAAAQMHYLSLILIPIGVILLIYEVWARKNSHMNSKNLPKGIMLGMITFALVMSPLVIFDFKHNFLNYRAITELLSGNGAVKAAVFSNLARIPSLFSYNLIGRYMTGENYILQILLSLLLLLPFLLLRTWSILALGVWLLVGLFGVSFYQQDIYDHYLGFMNPVPFLLLGSITTIKIIPRKFVAALMITLVLSLTYVNFQKSPLRFPPNNQLKRTIDVAKFIINASQNKDFNFALIAKSNYDSAYQFYLDKLGHTPKQVPFDKTGQLFVVCEDESCDPTHNSKYEIVAYGWSKIDWMKEFAGVKIYRLVPNPTGKP